LHARLADAVLLVEVWHLDVDEEDGDAIRWVGGELERPLKHREGGWRMGIRRIQVRGR
jgi:hypothetical protein